MTLLKLIIFVQYVVVIMATNVNIGNIEKKILDQIFSPVNYDKRIRPRPNNTATSLSAPVNVSVEMFVLKLTFTDDEKQSFGVDMYLRQMWQDERLKYDNVNGRIQYLTLNSVESIWTPDLFFTNEIKGHLYSITTPNLFVRIFPDGHILLSMRLSLKATAELNYQKFPFDSQELQLKLTSYAYRADDLLLQWRSSDAADYNREIRLPLFSIEKLESEVYSVRVSTGEYPYLKITITIARKLNWYLIHVFIPCTMLIIAAYLSVWLDIKFITGRLILSTASLYTLTVLINAFNNLQPRVNCTKMIDVFAGICSTFGFATLVESVVAQAFENCRCHNNPSDEQDQNSQIKTFNVKHMKQWLKLTPINKIDAIFRIVYPLIFIAFLIIFAIAAYI